MFSTRTGEADLGIAPTGSSSDGAPYIGGFRGQNRQRANLSGVTQQALLFLSAFLASAVEMVEALTIVLAAGVSRGWRSTLLGAGAAAVVLAVVVGVLGPAIAGLPLDVLRLVVGGLLLIFGLGWLRKAILRAAGLKALHDEEEAYEHELRLAREAGAPDPGRIDPYAFTLAFKGVFLEGLEVAFIVVTFGAAHQGGVALAAAAALLALLLVAGVGVAVRAPLSRIPENVLKFAVGLMLTTFGTFWAAEGAHAHWPGGELALLGLLAFFTAVALIGVRLLRRRARRAAPLLAPAEATS